MKSQIPSLPLSRPELISRVGDIVSVFPFLLSMSPEELDAERKKRTIELDAKFPTPQDRAEAQELIEALDAGFEQRRLQSIIDSKDPSQLWFPVASDDVLSGFLPGAELGTGGTSEVRECLTRFARHTVVIKLIRYVDAKERIDKLLALQELQTLLKFTHPNVVRVYDAGTMKINEGGQEKVYPYLAMELLKGSTLEDWIKANIPGDSASAKDKAHWLQIVANAGAVLAETLSACHAKHIAHGDFKPNNVKVCGTAPSRDTLKVYDFGFSATDDGRVQGEAIAYSDPVVKSSDLQSMQLRDIYALGATCLFCVTGNHPPDLTKPDSRQQNLANSLAAVQDKQLRLIIQKAMDLDISNRYSTAKQLEEDLAAWLNDEPIPNLGIQYTWRERERLLIRRCGKRDDLRDATHFCSHVALVLAGFLALDVVVASFLIHYGLATSMAMTLFGVVMNVVYISVVLISVVIVKARRAALSQFIPVAALIVASELNLNIIYPEHIYRPTSDESVRAYVASIALTGLFNVIAGCYTPRWRYMQVFGWCVLVFVPVARYLADQPWFKDYTLIAMLAAHMLACLIFAIRGLAFQTESEKHAWQLTSS